jgi:hypothetical protein
VEIGGLCLPSEFPAVPASKYISRLFLPPNQQLGPKFGRLMRFDRFLTGGSFKPFFGLSGAFFLASGRLALTDRLDTGQTRNGGDHKAGKELHGCHVAVVESVRRSRESFEYA